MTRVDCAIDAGPIGNAASVAESLRVRGQYADIVRVIEMTEPPLINYTHTLSGMGVQPLVDFYNTPFGTILITMSFGVVCVIFLLIIYIKLIDIHQKSLCKKEMKK